MENTDNTILEMQQQMQQLRDKLNTQKIVNERLLRNACGNNINRLKLKSSVPIIAGFAGLALLPALHHMGFSYWFLICTGVMLIAAMVAAAITRGHIPDVDNDLVTAAMEITRFRKINADWIKFGFPVLVVWIGLLALDIWKNNTILGDLLYPFMGGCCVGLLIGGLLGLKNRRDILRASDSLLAQIEELKGEQ